MRVRVKRDADIRMSEPFRDDFHIDALFQEERRMRVPQSMEGESLHFHFGSAWQIREILGKSRTRL